MSKVIFSIYVDIPDDKLDSPGWFNDSGQQINTKKSEEVKKKLKEFAQQLNQNKIDYAAALGVDYILYQDDDRYHTFCEMFRSKYPQISEYDIINFYKHWMMKELAEEYDQVCYLDYDVICNTNDDIFDAHDPSMFACAHSNEQAAHGKTFIHNYKHDIRNPATKYWNTHAMLSEQGYNGSTDVFNTGIMVATKQVIHQLGYFDDFGDTLDLMTHLKTDADSMYPKNIQRVFNYDNETVFAYQRVVSGVDIDYINDDWHPYILKGSELKGQKMYHMIGKEFEQFFNV